MNKKDITTNTQAGQVVILNTLLFFALSTAIIFAVVYPVISGFQVTSSFTKSKKAFMVANSASNEAVYKLNASMGLDASETVSLAQGSANIVVSDTSDGKTVTIQSDVETYERNYEIKLLQGAGVSFNYGLQTGQGGFEMSGGAGINGNVYANGDIIGTGGPWITGTAISANISDPVVVTSNNGGTIDPAHSLSLGGNSVSVPQDIAQSFTVSTTTPISSVRILVKKTGNPWSNVTLRIKNNSSGNPGNTTLAQGTISNSTVTSSFNYLTVPLTSTVSLVPGTTYWIVLDNSTNFWGPTYSFGANDNTYSGGVAKISANGSSWTNASPSTYDIYFDVYVGGSTGIIQGISVGGDAWAHDITNSTVSGAAYCQGGSGNNKSCDTSRPDPVQQPWPISEGNILEWKDIATEGGATSTVSLGSSDVRSMGPMKINGNLSVGGGAILNVTGTLYVTGNITVNGGGIVRVSPSMGGSSAIIVTDGRVNAGGGGQFQGSGTSGSYILLVTTSTCPTGTGCSGNDAVSVSGGTGAVVLNAQYGTMRFSGGAQAKQATANKIIMDGGTTVNYESGLSNPNFTSGPSGAWVIDAWKEVE